MTISKSHRAIQMTSAPGHLNMTELANQYSIPQISVHKKGPPTLGPRGFRKVPDLPAGWKAVFATTASIVPVGLSAKHLREFYMRCALSAAQMDDRWRWTIQVGQLVLQLSSRNRRQQNVTKELVLATVLMLNEFAKAGFTDLFFATLWHETDGAAVDIQLRVVERVMEGTKVHQD
ncbi:MAG: hypothetical protein LQ344_006943 [Seirophora lacunosa]|nr:MAG: hypothetical protein LQ344_006943 [Seirophora lacunosa]